MSKSRNDDSGQFLVEYVDGEFTNVVVSFVDTLDDGTDQFTKSDHVTIPVGSLSASDKAKLTAAKNLVTSLRDAQQPL